MHLIISCEHATHAVPPAWQHLFDGNEAVLQSHRGWDPGTLELGQLLVARMDAPLVAAQVSRLLVELNRSADHPQLWSEFSRKLSDREQQSLLQHYYQPHRDAVSTEVRGRISSGAVLHLSLHSFTPIWEEHVRDIDIGILYDPSRAPEQAFAEQWGAALQEELPGLRIRHNQPYLGTDDGLTTALRATFTSGYLGIELEINQQYALAHPSKWRAIQEAVSRTLQVIVAQS